MGFDLILREASTHQFKTMNLLTFSKQGLTTPPPPRLILETSCFQNFQKIHQKFTKLNARKLFESKTPNTPSPPVWKK